MDEAPRLEKTDNGRLLFDCPGCGMSHEVNVDKSKTPCWDWNGDMVRPTFKPSIRVRWDFGPERTPKVCHSFVRDGMIEFCGDCTHEHAGGKLPLPPVS